jgi:hypothetical protein
MKKSKLLYALTLLAPVFALQSCLTFDTPGAEATTTQTAQTLVTRRGTVDVVNYKANITGEQVQNAAAKIQTELAAGISAQFALRGGKNGEKPGPHAYQYQYLLGVDNYSQFGLVPHHDFPYAKADLASAYAIQPKFYGGAMGSFMEMTKFMSPLLNHECVDTMPEVKAIYLTLYNFSAVQVADVYGPFPYQDLKTNKQSAPFIYDDLETIYTKVVENLDTAVACFKYFETKSADYKTAINNILAQNIRITQTPASGTKNLDTWVRFANSVKLRLAMHIVKVNPTLARKWAEDAVKSGVIETTEQEIALAPGVVGFSHPLLEASESWHDTRITASMESLLNSLNHPYLKYLFKKNDNPIVNEKTKETLPANSKVVGIRSGVHTGEGQAYAGNQFIAFSGVNPDAIYGAPLYIMKLSEVCFLRAEGAIRGWNMGGSAKDFYEKGITYGNCEDRTNLFIDDNGKNPYQEGLAEYMAQEEATPYTYVDPTGASPSIKSVTKIGVKWNEGDSPEIKLEKIITQKYIAAYPESFEAWVDLRRTGYPKLFDVLNVDDSDGSLQQGDIIRRLPFPGRLDPATLQDIQATGMKALGGPDVVATRLWWDVNKGNF